MKIPEAAKTEARPRVRAAGATDPGVVRTGNEDRLHVDAERGIFVVADGVGGHAAGEIAASIAVDVIVQRLERPLWSPDRRVREAIALANNEILAQAQAAPERLGMTCVLTLALLTERGVTIGHVGDTRLYKLSSSGMRKLTHDHSPVGEREDAQEIGELEAMRHPRRNEVYRDVGSAFHQPDDANFVELIETSLDERSALLLCSDGLSDMIPSATIERLVRRHVGDPARVVSALIGAANDAGGRDNVTVVYVEGTQFARACASASDVVRPEDDTAVEASSSQQVTRGGLWQSRLTWLGLGALVGLAAGLALAWTLSLDAPPPLRPLVVGPGPEQMATIAEAMAAAAPGDLVRLEPGEYAEAVDLADGVHLEARIPGTVTLVAPSDRQDWVSLQAAGRLGNQIRGIRVRGRPEAPVATALRLTGHALQVTDVTIEGDVHVGIDIANDGDISVGASRFVEIAGTPVRIGPTARPIIRDSLFRRSADRPEAAIDQASGARPILEHNTFLGYPVVLGPAGEEGSDLPEGNVSVPHASGARAGARAQ